MVISKLIKKALEDKGIPFQTIHSRKRALRKKVHNAISSEVALDIVAAEEGIDIHKLLKKENRLGELDDYKQARGTYDFSEEPPKRNKPQEKTIKKEKDEKSPYDLSLAKYNLDSELIRDCKLIKPYRNSIREALLTLETKIQNGLGLDSSYYGMKLIKEMKQQGVFKRKIPSEEQGLYFLFAGAIGWLRNPASHKKIQYAKEDALKIVLFTDHLMKLFDDLKNKRI